MSLFGECTDKPMTQDINCHYKLIYKSAHITVFYQFTLHKWLSKQNTNSSNSGTGSWNAAHTKAHSWRSLIIISHKKNFIKNHFNIIPQSWSVFQDITVWNASTSKLWMWLLLISTQDIMPSFEEYIWGYHTIWHNRNLLFQNIMSPSSTVKIEAVQSFKMLVHLYWTTWYYSLCSSQPPPNLQSHTSFFTSFSQTLFDIQNNTMTASILTSRMCFRQCFATGSVRSPHFTPPSVNMHFVVCGGRMLTPSVAWARRSRAFLWRTASTPLLLW